MSPFFHQIMKRMTSANLMQIFLCEHEFKIFQGAFPRAGYPEVVNTNPHGSIGQSIIITIMVVILVFIKYLRLNEQSETS